MSRFSSLVFLLFLFSVSVFSQNPAATPPVEETDTLKISTSLIQVDVTVTDKDGKIVTDLKSEDFEVYENGKKQDITNFSFIAVDSKTKSAETAGSPAVSNNKNSIPIPPVKLKAEQVRRTYALVIDDLGLNFTSIYWVKQSLKKFVNEQMQEGDLAAIVRTGGGIGALQSFTSDKRQLMAAIEKIKWNSIGRSGISTFEPIRPTLKEELEGRVRDNEVRNPQGGQNDKDFLLELEEIRNESFAVGTLGALNYIIRGMNSLPGRKAVMLFSEGFALTSKNRRNQAAIQSRLFYAMRVLADLANRSSVVIYTLDPRGLVDAGMLGADDDAPNIFSESLTESRNLRERNFAESQQTLRYLAYETGGFPFVNNNDLDSGMRRAIADQSSYYLLGYQPDSETFDPKKNKFNKLEIKLTRPGLKVRYRSGFFAITDEKIQNVAQTPREKLAVALLSPFGANDVSLSLYPVYQNEAKNGDLIQALVHINANDLSFTKTENKRKANFDIMATTFGDNGVQLDSLSKNYTLEVAEAAYQNMLKNGFVYNVTVPIKKPGAYQFRIALRDGVSNKIGSVSQFIEVPKISKKITLSNLVLDNFTPEEWQKIKISGNRNESERSVLLDTALRQFKRGTLLSYDYVIYNPKLSRQITAQIRLIRDGRIIYEEAAAPVEIAGQPDLMRLPAAGALTLGKDLTVGNYILQTIIVDQSAKEKSQFATQFVEFEIVE